MFYVYILKSLSYPDQIYIGYTKNLEERFYNHNVGSSSHTAKFKPWKLVTYIAFDEEDKAVEFEKYLKSHSGRAFRDKRLI